LGDGRVDIGGFVAALEADDYEGWYVIEQDVVLDSEPETGQGPVIAAERSFAFLEGIANDL
jgi:inosose dehydratase